MLTIIISYIKNISVEWWAIIASLLLGLLNLFIPILNDRKKERKKFVIKENYDTFVNLLENLKDFFTDVTEEYDYFGYEKNNKKLKKDLLNRLKINFIEYTKKQEKEGLSCDYNKLEVYLYYIEKFEKTFLDDISKIAILSHPSIKKIVIRIENIYISTKKRESLLFESLEDELGHEEYENESGYINFKKDAYWGYCWLEILPLLKKLQNNLDKAVDLKKI
jgi:hypothetical protein